MSQDIDAVLFGKLRDLVYERSGLYFEDSKRYFFDRRVDGRVEAAGASGALDYYHMLRYGDQQDEFQALVESLTTHETYFFREYPMLRVWADITLPEILDRKRAAGDMHLDIWSAGCSTGEEAYTLAIILREVIDDFDRWEIRLTATDISRPVLRKARRATYGERSVRDVPPAYMKRWFRETDDEWLVTLPITRLVHFRHANLLDKATAGELRGQDFIFCRNVLIYFDDESRRQAMSLFYDSLDPGGYIFLGHSESVGRSSSAFQSVRSGDQLVYRK